MVRKKKTDIQPAGNEAPAAAFETRQYSLEEIARQA